MLYKVASRIDLSGKTYIPEGQAIPTNPNMDIDSTGYVELSDKDAPALLKLKAVKPLNEEIARLERKRDEALGVAKRAQADLDTQNANLQKVIDARRKKGARTTDELAVEQSRNEQIGGHRARTSDERTDEQVRKDDAKGPRKLQGGGE
jgi:hypothetical protein